MKPSVTLLLPHKLDSQSKLLATPSPFGGHFGKRKVQTDHSLQVSGNQGLPSIISKIRGRWCSPWLVWINLKTPPMSPRPGLEAKEVALPKQVVKFQKAVRIAKTSQDKPRQVGIPFLINLRCNKLSQIWVGNPCGNPTLVAP